ncbi:MAG: HdeA family protein [Rhodobacteraceae bacterium]|nr:HdeA family protein [Paracoccaceae bacterium]
MDAILSQYPLNLRGVELRNLLLIFVQVAISLSLCTAAQARQSFDPTLPCSEFLNSGDAGDKTLVVFWASGYLAKSSGKPREITAEYLAEFSAELTELCAQTPLYPLNTVVSHYALDQAKPDTAAPTVAVSYTHLTLPTNSRV